MVNTRFNSIKSAMCALCSATSIPVCTLAGGCGINALDIFKVIAISGGAGFGAFFTFVTQRNKN